MSVDIKVGRDNQTLSVLPLINTGFSALNDASCTTCTNKKYNAATGNFTVNGANKVTNIMN